MSLHKAMSRPLASPSQLWEATVPSRCVATGSLSVFLTDAVVLQGFDSQGEEKYWTVTDDNVSALAFLQVNMDAKPEVLIRILVSILAQFSVVACSFLLAARICLFDASMAKMSHSRHLKRT